jgi:predicted RNA-binding protein YlqC (UPF0109 family)
MSMVRDLIEYLAAKVVDNPGAVSVEAHGDRDVTYLIRVAPGEEGRVIGKGGRVIQAIRTLARAAAGPRERVQVDVVSAPAAAADSTSTLEPA